MEDKQNEVLENKENEENEEITAPKEEIAEPNEPSSEEPTPDFTDAVAESEEGEETVAPVAEAEEIEKAEAEDQPFTFEAIKRKAPLKEAYPEEEKPDLPFVSETEESEETAEHEEPKPEDAISVAEVPEAEDYLTDEKKSEYDPSISARERKKRNKKEWRELDREHRKEEQHQPKEKKPPKRTAGESGALAACFGATIGFCVGLVFNAGVIGLVAGGAVAFIAGFIMHKVKYI